ncbi:50S ribosomal protein L3 [archaeon]|nr:50S ribosomal protein L3 [archaeon]|tara:strand:- start:3036 stop:4025 length:990 start_codon:yes stop_codon:yes gene_type:complete
MPRQRRPRRGSTGYTRKRANKLVHNIVSNPRNRKAEKEPRIDGFACFKAGMTQITYNDTSIKYTKGKLVSKAVTVLDAPSLFVCGVRYYSYATSIGDKKFDMTVLGEKWSASVPKAIKNIIPSKKAISDEKKNETAFVRIIVCTQPTESGMKKKKADILELDVCGEKEAAIKYAEGLIGKELNVEDVFKPGDYVDAAGVTKGFGFTGPVKRFGIKIQGRKNEQHHRHVGCTGSETPAKMDWRTPAAGQYGFFNRVELNKRLVAIGDDSKKVNPNGGFVRYGLVKNKYVLIEGSVPGIKKRVIFLRKALRNSKSEPVEIKDISLESQQGD